jgi:choline kinase
MQGLILAAGRGSRLGGHSPETPKCLLEVGRRPLIEHQLQACAEAGIAPVALVLGYCADEVREVVGIRAEYVHNARWATTNSIYSFWAARHWIQGSLVVMNCDILFEPAVLARLLATGGDALVYDSSSGDGLEQMKVKAEGGKLVDMSKELSAEEACGENIGILYFTAETARAVIERAGEIIAAGGHCSWLAAAVRDVAKQRPIRVVDVAGLAWGEIDSVWDLEIARKSVWPVVRRSTRPPARRRFWSALPRWAALPFIPLAFGTGVGVWQSTAHNGIPPTSWETLRMRGAPTVEIQLPDRSQSWWMLDHDGAVSAHVNGPGPVRLDSRIILQNRGAARAPYVLRVEVDGVLHDLYKKDGRIDLKARFGGAAIARRKELSLDLSPGPHTISVRLMGSEPGDRCLIRARAPESDEGES